MPRQDVPPQGQRDAFLPLDDFKSYGDGGAFPEIDIEQYPLEIGRVKQLVRVPLIGPVRKAPSECSEANPLGGELRARDVLAALLPPNVLSIPDVTPVFVLCAGSSDAAVRFPWGRENHDIEACSGEPRGEACGGRCQRPRRGQY
jgi:hypothetical protein